MVWVSGEGYELACNSSADQKLMGTPQHGDFAKSIPLIWQPQWFRLPPAACAPQPMPTQVNRNFLLTSKEIYQAFFCQPLSAIKAILCSTAWWTPFLGWCFSSITAWLLGLVVIIPVKVESFCLCCEPASGFQVLGDLRNQGFASVPALQRCTRRGV